MSSFQSGKHIVGRAFEKLERFGPERGDLCDLPCGTGNLSMLAHEAGWRVHPYDISPEVWEGGDALRVTPANMNEPLDIPDDRFDALGCCEGMEHIENPYLVLREFRRIVRPGGVVVISTPNTIDLRQRFRFLRQGFWGHYPPAVPDHINGMGTFLLCHALVNHGFEILDIDSAKVYGGALLRGISRRFGYGRKSGLPDAVNRLLSSPRVLCGRTVVITARVG